MKKTLHLKVEGRHADTSKEIFCQPNIFEAKELFLFITEKVESGSIFLTIEQARELMEYIGAFLYENRE